MQQANTMRTNSRRIFIDRAGPKQQQHKGPPNPRPCSCPRCQGWLYVEYSIASVWDLKCISCARVVAEWVPGQPVWRWLF